MQNKLKKRGFTLIELLVVVLIVGILAAVAVPQYQKAVEKSRLAGVWATMGSLRQAAAVAMMNPETTNTDGISSWNPKNLDASIDCIEAGGARQCWVTCPSTKWGQCNYSVTGTSDNPIIRFIMDYPIDGERKLMWLHLSNDGRSCTEGSEDVNGSVCQELGQVY